MTSVGEATGLFSQGAMQITTILSGLIPVRLSGRWSVESVGSLLKSWFDSPNEAIKAWNERLGTPEYLPEDVEVF